MMSYKLFDEKNIDFTQGEFSSICHFNLFFQTVLLLLKAYPTISYTRFSILII